MLLYSLDSQVMFDPYQLDIDITEENIHATLKQQQYLKALVVLISSKLFLLIFGLDEFTFE